MTIGNRIRYCREKLDMTLEELSGEVGVSRQTLSRYETGVINTIPSDRIESLAIALHTTPAYLMGWETSDYDDDDSTSPVRFLGEIAAGYDHIANEEYEYLRIPTEWLRGRPASDYFAMRVTGSSMYPMFCDGDELLCLSTNDAGGSGKVAILIYGEEATLKKLEYPSGKEWLDLVPINPEYQTKRISGVELERCRVIGVPVRLIRSYQEN